MKLLIPIAIGLALTGYSSSLTDSRYATTRGDGQSLFAQAASVAPAYGVVAPIGPDPAQRMPKAGEEVAVMETNFGRVVLMFFPDKAPNHVKNFKKLARSGFYDGTKFHRVIPHFMIQGGDPNTKKGDPSTWGMGGPPTSVKAEFNDVKHVRGILSMARSADPDSAGSQFFIMVASYPSLDGKYSAFGRAIEGMATVDKIVNLPTEPGNRPKTPAIIKSVRIVKWPIKK